MGLLYHRFVSLWVFFPFLEEMGGVCFHQNLHMRSSVTSITSNGSVVTDQMGKF